MSSEQVLRIAYVPEHYALPLLIAQSQFHLPATLHPYPSGTGHMITALRASEVDLAIGLTEGWVAGLANAEEGKEGYTLVGSWVQSPLCWAISTGLGRDDLSKASDLKKGDRVGISRHGSGSEIMASILASQLSLPPTSFQPRVLTNFAGLRAGVNNDEADFFLWERFTTASSYELGAIDQVKKIGEVEAPWPSWLIAARTGVATSQLAPVLASLQEGMDWVRDGKNRDQGVSTIVHAENMHYSEANVREWWKGVVWTETVAGVDEAVLLNTLGLLEHAGAVATGASDRLESLHSKD